MFGQFPAANPYMGSSGINALPNTSGSAPDTVPANTPLGQPLSFWVGAIVLLLVLKFASEHESTSINPAHIHVGGYNVLTLLTAWIVGWALLKLSINKYFPSSGAATFVNFL